MTIHFNLLFANSPENPQNPIYNKIENFIQEKKYKEALDRLNVGYLTPVKDWKYYDLKARSHLGLDQVHEALDNFENSIQKKHEQPEILTLMSELYDSVHKFSDAFRCIRLSLALDENHIYTRYRSFVLASRLNDTKYVGYALSKIEKLKPKDWDIKEINKTMENLYKSKNFKDLRDLSKKYISYYPKSFHFHKYYYISAYNLDPKDKKIEAALLDAISIFKNSQIAYMNLGLYYQKTQKYYKSLSIFRRAYLKELLTPKDTIEEEILYGLKQTYYLMNLHKDAEGINSLIQLIREKNQSFSDLDNLLKTHKNHREVLIYGQYISRKLKNIERFQFYTNALYERDSKKKLDEYMDILLPFSFEKIEIEWESGQKRE